MDDGKVTITIEIDAELLAQVTEVLKPYGLTPEEAAVQFFEYCADPKTQDHAITLLKRWKEEQEDQERNSTNAKHSTWVAMATLYSVPKTSIFWLLEMF